LGRERPVVAGRGLHVLAELGLGAREMASGEQLATELGPNEERSLSELDERIVVGLSALEVRKIEAEPEQDAPGLLDICAGFEQGQRLFVVLAGALLVAAVCLEVSQGQGWRRILRPFGDGRL